MKAISILMVTLFLVISPSQPLVANDKPKAVNDTRTVLIYSFTNGNSYLKSSQTIRENYVAGVIDGIRLAPAFGVVGNSNRTLEVCFTDMSIEQMEAIVSKYLKDNPSEWNQHMNMLVLKSFLDLPCYKKP